MKTARNLFLAPNQSLSLGEVGEAFYQARNLAMDIKQEVIDFIDNCDKLPRRAMGQQTETSIDNKASAFKLYPNPNDGNYVIEHPINTEGELIIYDVTGKQLYSYIIEAGSNKILIVSDNLNNGVYFYEIRVNNQKVDSNKLIIIK